MIPNPLHPAVVHFPIVFVVVLPFIAAGALWAIRRGANARRAWLAPLVLAAGLAASAFVAVQSGQAQGERVERVVRESAVDGHEEAAELFLVLSVALLGVAGVGMAKGTVGQAARLVAMVGSLGLLGAGYRVGTSGGELVYRHGAANAYVQAGPSTAPSPALEREGGVEQ